MKVIQLTLIDEVSTQDNTHHTESTPITSILSYWVLTPAAQTSIRYQIEAEQQKMEEEQRRIVGYFTACEHEIMVGPDHYRSKHEYHLVCTRCVEEHRTEENPFTPDDYGWQRVTRADYENDKEYPQFIYYGGLCEDCGKKLVEAER